MRPARFLPFFSTIVLAIQLWCADGVVVAADGLRVFPESVELDRPESSQQLLVFGRVEGRDDLDLTRMVSYRVIDPAIVSVDARGVVLPLGEGRTEIAIEYESQSIVIPVAVGGLGNPPAVSFENEIVPILTKSRCNSGGCHGKADGQNGFKLSVFGFDPLADHAALVSEARGRRLSIAVPSESLLLLKAAAIVPHGGGKKISSESPHFARLKRWIASGAPLQGASGPVASISIEPRQRTMRAGESQQLQVFAVDASGGRRCVTSEVDYESNDETIAQVDSQGLIRAGDVPGEASILIRYMGQVGVCRVTHPQASDGFIRPPENNFVDLLVWDRLKRLGVQPSELADDATFLRRVSLDVIGTLPTVSETQEFLADTGVDKRERLIDRLLKRDEYADYWTMRWSDILRVDQDRTSPQGAVAITRWLHRQFASNRPYDEFVREILTAQGSTGTEGPAAVFKVLDSPEVASRSFSQLFLGVRIECAQCHHHPYERWGQDDYFGLAGFFTGVSPKSLPGGGQAILVKAGVDLKHPRTGDAIATKALGAPVADLRGVSDRRQSLAVWMTSPENPYFAKAIANRLWSHYFGRGLVEPIDDFRATNPATNEPLLEALAVHLRDVRYDLRRFTRTLLTSRVYQLSSTANESNATDLQNFSHARDRALPAEVLLDAISQATESPEKFAGWPAGYRAIQVWDNRLPSYFLRIFGRPIRASVCECERSNDPSISQALHLMNSKEILGKISTPDGRARRLAESTLAPDSIIEELYSATLARLPTPEESSLMRQEFSVADRRSATEDILWTLINSKEFLYNH